MCACSSDSIVAVCGCRPRSRMLSTTADRQTPCNTCCGGEQKSIRTTRYVALPPFLARGQQSAFHTNVAGAYQSIHEACYHAAMRGRLPVVELLLEHGADIDARSSVSADTHTRCLKAPCAQNTVAWFGNALAGWVYRTAGSSVLWQNICC